MWCSISKVELLIEKHLCIEIQFTQEYIYIYIYMYIYINRWTSNVSCNTRLNRPQLAMFFLKGELYKIMYEYGLPLYNILKGPKGYF